MRNRYCCWITFFLLLLTGCYKEENISPEQVIVSVDHSPASSPADGVSRTMISVEIPAGTTDGNNSIVLLTSKGLFDVVSKNSITVTAQNVMGTDGNVHKIATAYLVSTTDTLPAIVTATIKNYSRTDTVLFHRAYASQIRVLTDKIIYIPSATSEVVVTVQLRRNVGEGLPSVGQAITLEALDINNNPVGNFRNRTLVTDASGNCVNYFSMSLPNTYIGPVKFRTTTQKDAMGTLISDSTIINIH